MRAIQECSGIRPGPRFAERRLDLRRQHEQLSPRLHHDLSDIPPCGGDNLHRLALRGSANLIAKASKLISLRDPRVPADAILLDEIRDRSSGRTVGFRSWDSDIVSWRPAGFTTPTGQQLCDCAPRNA